MTHSDGIRTGAVTLLRAKSPLLQSHDARPLLAREARIDGQTPLSRMSAGLAIDATACQVTAARVNVTNVQGPHEGVHNHGVEL